MRTDRLYPRPGCEAEQEKWAVKKSKNSRYTNIRLVVVVIQYQRRVPPVFVAWHLVFDNQSRRPSARASVAAWVLRFRALWRRRRRRISVALSMREPEILPPYYISLSTLLGSTPEPSRRTHTRNVSTPQPCHLDKQVVFHTHNLSIQVSPSGDNV